MIGFPFLPNLHVSSGDTAAASAAGASVDVLGVESAAKASADVAGVASEPSGFSDAASRGAGCS